MKTQRKLLSAMDSLRTMKIRSPYEQRATWRDRFLEIARQVEADKSPRALALAALGRRPRISAAAGQRSRLLAPTA